MDPVDGTTNAVHRIPAVSALATLWPLHVDKRCAREAEVERRRVMEVVVAEPRQDKG